MSPTCFEPCLYLWHVNKLYHASTYSRRPEDEPSGSKHVEVIVKNKILLLTKVQFVALYHMIILQCAVHNIKLSLPFINRIGRFFGEGSHFGTTCSTSHHYCVSHICNQQVFFTSLVFLTAATPCDNISIRTISGGSLCFPYKHVYSLYNLVEELYLLRSGK